MYSTTQMYILQNLSMLVQMQNKYHKYRQKKCKQADTSEQFGPQQCLCCAVCDGLHVHRQLRSIHNFYSETERWTLCTADAGLCVYDLTVASSVDGKAEGTDRFTCKSGCESALMK